MGPDEFEYCDPQVTYNQSVPIRCPLHLLLDHYTNTCVPAALLQFTDQEKEAGMAFIYGFLLPVLSFIVLASHLIVVWVLYEQKNRRASVEPLLWMAISAIFMAISPLPYTIYYYNLKHVHDINQDSFLCNLEKISMEILPFFFNTLITMFTLLLGIQRFVAIQFPLDSFRWCTRKKIRTYSKLIFLSAVGLSILHYSFDARIIYHMCVGAHGSDETFWVARCFVGYSSVTRMLNSTLLSDLFDISRIVIALVPSVLLFIITILLIKAVKSNDKTFSTTNDNRQMSTINRHRKINKTSRNTTVMLTVIIALFLIGRLPSTILILIVHFSSYLASSPESTEFDFLHDLYLRATANIIMMTVHPISFAVYMLMSRQFRVSLRKLLGIRCLASDQEMGQAKLHSCQASAITFRNKDSKALLIGTRQDSTYSFNSMRASVRTDNVRFCGEDVDGLQKTRFLYPDRLSLRITTTSVTNPDIVGARD